MRCPYCELECDDLGYIAHMIGCPAKPVPQQARTVPWVDYFAVLITGLTAIVIWVTMTLIPLHPAYGHKEKSMQTTSPQGESYIEHHGKGPGHGVTLVGPAAVAIVRYLYVAQALECHVKTKGQMRLTRMATPSAMMAMAKEYLGDEGKKLKARDYSKAAELVRAKIERDRALIPEGVSDKVAYKA